MELNRNLQQQIAYVIRLDPGVQAPERTLELGSGSCRDSTLAARANFPPSGPGRALCFRLPDSAGPGREGHSTERQPGRATTSRISTPGARSTCLEPAGSASIRPSGLLAGEGHIPLACTPEPSTAAPISGGVESSDVEFAYEMTVQRIFESPRVTRPYTDEQWDRILACGSAVDAELAAGDVRLTMGGEPTFVSVTEREADEWNIAALGPTKRARATALLARMKERYGPRGFAHMGQGKWYPGEPLPRWSLGWYWRADGEPAWTDPALVADEQNPDGYGAPEAERFVSTLAGQLGVTASHVLAGYEEVWFYLCRERRLPTNVDPLDARLDDELERDRLRQVFTQGLGAVVGYALPLQRVGGRDGHWATGRWFLRTERLYLVPGDSPMGFRLPLDSLPWSSPDDRPAFNELDPFAPRQPIPPSGWRRDPGLGRADRVASRHAGSDIASAPRPPDGPSEPVDDGPGTPPSRGESAAGVGAFGVVCPAPRRHLVRLHAAAARRSRSTWIWLPPSKPPRMPSACACCSRAIRRRPIRGCRIFSSPRIPV